MHAGYERRFVDSSRRTEVTKKYAVSNNYYIATHLLTVLLIGLVLGYVHVYIH